MKIIYFVSVLVYHTKLHTSQTPVIVGDNVPWLVYHTKLHTSQTSNSFLVNVLFDNHKKLHTSQTLANADNT